MSFSRRRLLLSGAGLAAVALSQGAMAPGAFTQTPKRKPNFIIVLADDLGYGDLGAFGAKLIRTPNLDRMAKEGAVLTSFYASANVCTPSRAGLLTGRYPIRTGLAYSVIQPNDKNGLPASEITIAEALKPDYATALIGKWHLGHVAPFWPPTNHGFDLFHGLPYSHDMRPLSLRSVSGDGVEIIHDPVGQGGVDFPNLTTRFFDRGMKFVEQNLEKPFFLMLALTAPHVPLVPDAQHAGHSDAGIYGDVVEEIDTSIGAMMAKLKELGLDRDTMVIVTSDNGPWFAGSSGPLRERKGAAGWDGAYRVPFMARQPGVIPAGLANDAIAMNIDLMPTLCAMAGVALPAVTLDGRDIAGLMTRKGTASPHEDLILFNNEKVVGIRTQRWKLVTNTYYRTIDFPLEQFGYTHLSDLSIDPGEEFDVSGKHPEVMKDMQARLSRARSAFEPLAVRTPTGAPRP